MIARVSPHDTPPVRPATLAELVAALRVAAADAPVDTRADRHAASELARALAETAGSLNRRAVGRAR